MVLEILLVALYEPSPWSNPVELSLHCAYLKSTCLLSWIVIAIQMKKQQNSLPLYIAMLCTGKFPLTFCHTSVTKGAVESLVLKRNRKPKILVREKPVNTWPLEPLSPLFLRCANIRDISVKSNTHNKVEKLWFSYCLKHSPQPRASSEEYAPQLLGWDAGEQKHIIPIRRFPTGEKCGCCYLQLAHTCKAVFFA